MVFFLAQRIESGGKTLYPDNKEVNGVVGLSTPVSGQTGSSYVSLLYEQSMIPAPVFSLVIGGPGQQSSITLGQSNTAYVKTGSDFNEFDAASSNGWGVSVTSFNLGNSQITSGDAVFSSTATNIVLDASAYSTWKNQLP